MPIIVGLFDSESFNWDFQSGRVLNVLGTPTTGLGIINGTSDTFDTGMLLRVNGTGFNPDLASLDLNGRELNTQALLMDGIAVSRSILVSDAAISAVGFARFFDSFTNTTDAVQTITVDIALNSGADGGLVVPRTSSGDGVLTASDTGFVLDDLNTIGGDSALAYVYGGGASGFVLPSAASLVGDNLAISYTLTLAPGQTQSLLSFATQSVLASQAIADLPRFGGDAFALNSGNFLAGLSRDEQLSVVNYSGFDRLQAPATLVDADGNRWSIDTQGRLASLDTTALARFDIPILRQNFDQLQSLVVDDEANEVTVVTGGFEAVPESTVTYTYRALDDQAVIRLLVTWTTDGATIGNVTLAPVVTAGASPALLSNTVNVGSGTAAAFASGVLLDDSPSGSGGTLPALSYVFGATGTDNSSQLTGSVFSSTMPLQGVSDSGPSQYLFFFALNDTGQAGLADLVRLNEPGPEALAGLSDADLAGIRNFQLTAADRLDVSFGSEGDDVIVGNAWGDSIEGAQGDDEISGGASDDVLIGGFGGDVLHGDAGNDTLAGGNGSDQLLGGIDDDLVFGEIGNDTLYGGSGGDQLFGGDGNDRLFGGVGFDTLEGGIGTDRLRGDTGNDLLTGGADRDFFVFDDDFGNDRITDFTDRVDRIDFRSHGGARSIADLGFNQVGLDALITLADGSSILLDNFEVRFLTAGDFIFT